MIDYSKWKQTNKAVTTLQLDVRNPRLPPRTSVPTQLELIAELIAHENVYALAKRIVERGYYRHELPIAVEEHGKTVIVEGNRRLCALKLLISPNLAPESERRKYRKLSVKASIASIRKIPVLIAPNREASAPPIQSKHTRREVESWEPAMQARFYADRIADGESIDDLSQEYAITPSAIMDFLQNYQMYQVACALDLPPDVALKVRDAREFPLTNLERVFRNSEASAFLGISFDTNRQLKGTVPVAEFKKAFGKVVTDVALGRVNSRNLNTSEEFKKYLTTFGPDAPDRTQKGAFSAKDLIGPGRGKAAVTPKNVPQPSPKPQKPQAALLAKTFVCGIDDVRINSIVRELKKVSAEDCPNAAALTLRGFVDLVIGDYCDRVGATEKILTRAREKEKKPDDWYPSVRQMLNYVVSNSASLTIHPLALKAAKMLVNDDQPVAVLMLDAFAHNKYVIPTPTELRSFWTRIEEAMQAMLTPPAATTHVGSK